MGIRCRGAARVRAVAVALASFVSSVAPVVHGDGGSNGGGEADALFDEAVKLFEYGDTRAACSKFAESMRIDPANGTLQNLALCHEKEGRTATAWQEFTQLAARAARDKQPDRERLGRQKASALGMALSRVTLQMASDANAETIRVDGTELPRSEWATPVAMDPGGHALTFAAPGKKTLALRVTVAPGPSTQTIVVANLEDEASPKGEADAESPHPSEGLGAREEIEIGLAGAGLVGVAVGSVYGLVALSKWSQAKNDCSPSCGTSSPAIGERSDAQSAATVSTVAFVIGGLAIAGAGVLYFTTPHGPAVAPAVGPGSAGFIVRGVF